MATAMICPRCLLRTSAPLRAVRPSACRKFTSTPSIASTHSPAPSTTTNQSHPAATADQSSSENKGIKHNSEPTILSSVPAGTPLKGLNYFKGKDDPVAMADEDYPPWLWKVLDEPKKSGMLGAGKEEEDPRLYSKSANARRAANKKVRAKAAANPELAVHKTPVFEQSVDLPSEGRDADDARFELQRAMRQKRKSDIKTANFLKSMR